MPVVSRGDRGRDCRVHPLSRVRTRATANKLLRLSAALYLWQVSEVAMTRKKSAPTISEEELSNRRCQFARILFLERLTDMCPQVREDLLKIWKQLEPRIRQAISALQDQVYEAFDAVQSEVLAEYDRSGIGNFE